MQAGSGSLPEIDQPTANLRWLGRFINRYRWAATGALVSGGIGGITSAAEPYLIGIIIDRIRQNISLDELAGYAVALLGLAIITVVAFYGQRRWSGTVAYFVNFDIRQTLFDNLLTLDQRFYQTYPTGDLISRMYSDLDMIWRLLAIGFTRFGSAFVILIVTFILLGTINVPLTIVVFIVLTISTAIQMRAGSVLAPVFEQVQAQAGTLSAFVQDSVSGIQTIKTFGREEGASQAFLQENLEYKRRWLYFKRRNEPVGMLPNMISELTAAVVVVFGGVLTLQGSLSIGNFVQFLIYLGMISNVLLQLGTIYQRLQQTKGALTRLTPLLQHAAIHTNPQAAPLPSIRGEITFEDVGLQQDGIWLLRNVSLTIPAGKVVALVGPTGCGKTLLINLLARIMDPSEGRVLIDGRDVQTIPLEELRRFIAYVPQSPFCSANPFTPTCGWGRAISMTSAWIAPSTSLA
ncbi:MAG: ABC transporter ATP-binding protein [Anaerolineae bacterium]|nr:ABC transporter ATP-binding protein [Anaerolineae bacterium]